MANTSNEPYTPLGRAVVEGGLERVPFFNGRVLTAEDLQVEQEADALARDRLGRAVGPGVLEGLWVCSDEPAPKAGLVVDSGIGLNREGRAVHLPRRTRVDVLGETERDTSAGTEGGFADCAAIESVATAGSGAYLLVLEPAADTRGRVPRTELGGDGAAGSCGARRRLEGGRLKLVGLDPIESSVVSEDVASQIDELTRHVEQRRSDGGTPEKAMRSRLRNLLAHACLGSGDPGRSSRGLYAHRTGGGSLERRGEARGGLPGSLGAIAELGPDQVPLALIYWAVDRIEILDVWSARTVVRPETDGERAAAVTDRRLERLFQSVDHLADIVSSSGSPRQLRLDEHVRFVPALAVVAEFGLDHPRGVDADRFLERFSRGTGGALAPGPLTDLIERSLRYPPVDLEARPNLLRFAAADAPETVSSGRFERPVTIFVHRDLGVPSDDDGATSVFETARSVYRSVLESRAFEPGEVQGTRSIVGRARIREALRALAGTAGRMAVRTSAGSDVRATLRAFEILYEEQIRVIELFESTIDGIEDEAPRKRFARSVDARLRSGEDSSRDETLRSALDERDLVGAIDAQAGVNEFVGSWVGTEIAVGPTRLQHVGSPDGDQLVPPADGDQASEFRYVFDLQNGTDRELTFRLSAETFAPSGDWVGSTVVRDETGTEIASVTLDSAATQTLTVVVTPPEGATVGESADLTVRATVPAPNDRTMEESLNLPIRESSGTPTTHFLELSDLVVFNRATNEVYPLPEDPSTTPVEIDVSSDDPSSETEIRLVRLRADARFTASADPRSADVEVTAEASIPADSAGSVDDWPFDLHRDASMLGSSSDGKATGTYTATAGQTVQLKIDVNTPSEPDREAVFTLLIENPDLGMIADLGDVRLRTVT